MALGTAVLLDCEGPSQLKDLDPTPAQESPSEGGIAAPKLAGTDLEPAARVQFVASVLRSGLLFGFQWLLARAYGVQVFGICNTTQAGLQTATMFGRAAGDTVVLRGATGHVGSIRDAVSQGITLTLAGGGIAALGLVAWAAVTAQPSNVDGVWPAYLLAAATVPLAAAMFPIGAAFQATGQFRRFALTGTLLEPFSRVALLATIVALGSHWLWAMSSFPLAAAIAVAVALGLLQHTLRDLPATLPRGDRALQLMTFSSQTTIAAALQTAMLFAALSIADRIAEPMEVGRLAAAGRLVMLALWIQLAYAAPFLPLLPRMVGLTEKREELRSLYARIISSVLWFNAPLLVGMSVAARPVLRLFGHGFEEGADVLALLAVAQWVNSATALAEDFLPLSGRSRMALLNNLGALIVTIAGGLLLGPRLGIIGIAIAYAGATVGLNILRAVQVQWLFGATVPYVTVAKAAAASVGSAIAWGISDNSRSSGLPVGVAAGLTTFAIMYLIASPSERASLRSLISPRNPGPAQSASR